MSNRYSEFIQANQELWSKVPAGEGSNSLLLVEPQRHPIISHANAVFARIIKEARGLSIGWMDTGNKEIQERMVSYDPTSRTVPLSRWTHFDKLVVISKFARSALKMSLTGDILSFSLDGIRFGDILYDSYLARFQVATIPRVNRGVLSTLLILIKNYYRFKRTLQDCGASAVLVSHQVGLSSGVLFRTALGSGIEAYLRKGGGTIGLLAGRYTSLKEIYDYQFKPMKCDIESLLAVEREIIEDQFDELLNERMRGSGDKDARLAYRDDKKIYTSRQEFASAFNIDYKKRNVFVMLHAFNDHPHSHFERMLFKDYYDWFVQTLEFARKKSDVNWIFKEHPTSRYYPTLDMVLKDHFTHCPDHIVFIGAETSFHSRSLLYLADVIITVLGTAGVEFPAAGGIPSIIAGDTFYNGFGFTVEPRSREEYFRVLSDIERIERLAEEQRYMAKMVFLYIQKYCHVPFDWVPAVSYDETKSPGLDTYYWDLIVQQYREQPDILIQQFNDYVCRVKQGDFTRLLSLPAPEIADSH